jgi:TPR repeat protein
MYAEGSGVEQSDEEAIALWEKAVEAGSEEAATNLKIMRGEPVDD